MTLNAFISFAANLAQFAIPAALLAWADRAWPPADAEAVAHPPRGSRD